MLHVSVLSGAADCWARQAGNRVWRRFRVSLLQIRWKLLNVLRYERGSSYWRFRGICSNHFLSLTLLAGRMSGGRSTTDGRGDETRSLDNLAGVLVAGSSGYYLEGKGSDGVDYTEKMITITARISIAFYRCDR